MRFEDLGLSPELLKAIDEAGYSEPTPIQEKAIPYVLMNRDVLGVAQTGTGKTASFVLPMIDILASGRARARMPRSLILEPTRELAAQVAENFEKYGKHHKLEMALLIGGERFDEQVAKLDRGVDVLIATPGRLLDLFDRGNILLADTKLLVIDEADRMLDMGFIPDVEKIVSKLPKIRQTLFFSATMAKEIRRLADAFLMNPKEVAVSKPASTAENVEQHLIKCKAEAKLKRAELRKLIDSEEITSALIFCNRKRDVGIVERSLSRHDYSCGALHGDMAQPARMETLKKFKAGEIKLLVCSDVAARGLDIPAVSHVFNFDVPSNSEDYVHRIGRTGRAGRSGKAFTLSTPAERKYVAEIEKLIGRKIQAEEAKPEEANSEGGKVNATKADAAEAETKESAKNEKQSEAKSSRGGRKRGGRGRGKDKNAGGAQPEKSEETSRERKDSSRGKDAANSNGDNPFGEHTPAFMLRPVPRVAAG